MFYLKGLGVCKETALRGHPDPLSGLLRRTLPSGAGASWAIGTLAHLRGGPVVRIPWNSARPQIAFFNLPACAASSTSYTILLFEHNHFPSGFSSEGVEVFEKKPQLRKLIEYFHH